MNLILFVGNDCHLCDEAEAAFRKVYKEELDSGEADIVNLDEDEKAQQIWMENELPVAPTMIVISDKMKIITVLDPSDIGKETKEEASPVVANTVKHQ